MWGFISCRWKHSCIKILIQCFTIIPAGINKVETSVCLRYKTNKKQQSKSNARCAVRCWVYINKCLASAVTKLAGFVFSVHCTPFSVSSSTSPINQQELSCSPRMLLMQFGSICIYFYKQFQKCGNERTCFEGYFLFSFRIIQ